MHFNAIWCCVLQGIEDLRVRSIVVYHCFLVVVGLQMITCMFPLVGTPIDLRNLHFLWDIVRSHIHEISCLVDLEDAYCLTFETFEYFLSESDGTVIFLYTNKYKKAGQLC